jgi:hypothetical protein
LEIRCTMGTAGGQHDHSAVPLWHHCSPVWQVISYPVACPNGSATHTNSTHDNCANPEAEAGTLVVSQVTLEVDNRFSLYGAFACACKCVCRSSSVSSGE